MQKKRRMSLLLVLKKNTVLKKIYVNDKIKKRKSQS